MVWFLVWAVLVIAALAVVAVLLRRLWRQAVALGRALSTASQVLARLADQVEALQAASTRDPHRTDATVFTGVSQLRNAVAELSAARAGRRAERASRSASTRDGWRAYWS